MAAKKTGCIVLGVVALFLMGLFAIAVVIGISGAAKSASMASVTTQHFDKVEIEPGAEGEVAVIDLMGLIASSQPGEMTESMVEDMKLALRQAADDDAVKAVVLRIDSPGGEVTASDIIYHEVCELRKTKPVVVHIGSVGASGGYYIACGGSYLMATETSITGSIGVIIQTLNYKELLGKVGLESVVFKSGKFKDILSGSRPMTDEEKAYIQGLVMQTYGKFVGIVAHERKIEEQKLRDGIADGRILSGVDAVGAGLIDSTGYVEDAYEKARELGAAPNARVVQYSARMKLGRFLRMLGDSKAPTIELMPSKQLQLEAGRIYLLPPFLAP